jgi:predicted nucleotidyltransferase
VEKPQVFRRSGWYLSVQGQGSGWIRCGKMADIKLSASVVIPMKTKEEIIRILLQKKPELQREFRVRSIALFGSYARGDQRPSSDVDILVDVDPAIGLRFVTLADNIERSLGIRVDLISRRAVSARNWKVIEQELVYV